SGSAHVLNPAWIVTVKRRSFMDTLSPVRTGKVKTRRNKVESQKVSVQATEVGERVVRREVDHAITRVHVDFDTGSAQIATPESCLADRCQQGQPSQSEEPTGERWSLSVPELESGIDDPHSIFGEVSPDGYSEGRIASGGA